AGAAVREVDRLSGRRDAADVDAAGEDHVEAVARVAFEEERLPGPNSAPPRVRDERLESVIAQTGEDLQLAEEREEPRAHGLTITFAVFRTGRLAPLRS